MPSASRGTDGSNPVPSGRESANHRFLRGGSDAVNGSIEASRLRVAPEMTRVVVAIDPAVTSGEEADETGIVVAGKDQNGHGYVLADISGRYPPHEWARLAIAAYRTHRAVGCRRCERVAEPKARIRSPPAVSQQTFGSSQDDAVVRLGATAFTRIPLLHSRSRAILVCEIPDRAGLRRGEGLLNSRWRYRI